MIFFSGLQIDTDVIKRVGKNSILIAIGGFILPLILGYFVIYYLTKNFNISIVSALILTATSASISIMTLVKLGKLKTVEGQTIANAAIIDDVMGIIVLSVISSISNLTNFTLQTLLLNFIINISFFTLIFFVVTFLIPLLLNRLSFLKIEIIYFVGSLIFIAIFCFFGGKINFFTITSCYFAGIFISKTEYKSSIEETLSIAQIIFVSVFFVFIGFQIQFKNIDFSIIPYILVFTFIAFIGKVLGGGFFAKIVGFDIKRSFRIGCGMLPRGEMALIIASITYYYQKTQLITEKEYISVIFMVIVTMLINFHFLKLLFFEKKKLKSGERNVI